MKILIDYQLSKCVLFMYNNIVPPLKFNTIQFNTIQYTVLHVCKGNSDLHIIVSFSKLITNCFIFKKITNCYIIIYCIEFCQIIKTKICSSSFCFLLIFVFR